MSNLHASTAPKPKALEKTSGTTTKALGKSDADKNGKPRSQSGTTTSSTTIPFTELRGSSATSAHPKKASKRDEETSFSTVELDASATEKKAKGKSVRGEETSFSTVELDTSATEKKAKGKSKRDEETSFSTVGLDNSATESSKVRLRKSSKAESRSLDESVYGKSHIGLDDSASVEPGSARGHKSEPITVSLMPNTLSSVQLIKPGASDYSRSEDGSVEGSANTNTGWTSLTTRQLVAPKPKSSPSRASVSSGRKGSYGTFGTATGKEKPSLPKTAGKPTANTRPTPAAAKPGKTSTQQTAQTISASTALERAALRDELLKAVKAGDAKAVAKAMNRIPSQVTDWRTYFPVEVPALGNLKLREQLGFSIPLLLRRPQLDAYLAHVEAHAQRMVQAESELMQGDSWMLTTYLRRCYEISLAFRDTPEQELREKAKWFELLMDSALRDTTAPEETLAVNLGEALNVQPLVGIPTMLTKCAILKGHVDSEVFLNFQEHVERVADAQARGLARLMTPLLDDKFHIMDDDRKRILLINASRMLFAMELTSTLAEPVGVTKLQLETMQSKLRASIELARPAFGGSYTFKALQFVDAYLTKALKS